MINEAMLPTVRDLCAGLSRLVEGGLGDLPVQIIIVPDSTLQAIARVTPAPGYDPSTDAAKLVEFDGVDGRLPMMMLTADYLKSNHMQTRNTQ